MNFLLHVRTTTGLEGLLANELKTLGARRIEPKSRVVLCEGDIEILYKINLWSRTAIRVLRPLATFSANDEEAFYQGVGKIDWSEWISPTGTLAIDANVRSSFSTHSLYIAQLAKDAIVDQFRRREGERPSVDLKQPDVRLAISLFQNKVQIFLDSSGESLHKRGYRLKTGAAPLNEALAAGILKLAEWDGKTPLYDPMCGSGTFVIEAALIAKNIAPGLLRKHFGFQNWPDYDEALFERLVGEARRAVRRHLPLPIRGSDRDPQNIAIAKSNLERAGLLGEVNLEAADFFVAAPPFETPGILVTNPPYDERLELEDAGAFWEAIGTRLKKAYAGWTAYVLCGNVEAAKRVGLRTSRRTELYNGAIECRLLKYEMHEGTRREFPTEVKNAGVKKPAALPARLQIQLDTFANRLKKNWKHLGKWARREQVTGWRVYNRDIPELPIVVDMLDDELYMSEAPSNSLFSPGENAQFRTALRESVIEITQLPSERVHVNASTDKEETALVESGVSYPIDRHHAGQFGSFLEQRRFRGIVRDAAEGRRVLNLYHYDDSMGRAARAGHAEEVINVSVIDRSGLEDLSSPFDLGVVSLPMFDREFDLKRDLPSVLVSVKNRIRSGGKIYVSLPAGSESLVNAEPLASLPHRDLTHQLVSPDFERTPRRYYVLDIP